MAMKAKHAFGNLENIDSAISAGKIDSYDILFVKDADGKPYVGWVDKNGQKVIVDDSAELAALETEIATKANAEEVNAAIEAKADAIEVEKKINQMATDSIANAKAYTDGKVEAAINEHMVKKYEITSVPEGTLIDYRDKEIRVMCPVGAVFTKQNVGAGGNANNYYMTFKTYAPDGAVGYIEHLGNQVDEEVLTDLKTDDYGRKYQPTWLALAQYDAKTDAWTYYGASSSIDKYIGWDYQIDWYDVNNVMIASDSVRINLSNEGCHSEIKPYYWNELSTKINQIENKIEEVTYEVIEF